MPKTNTITAEGYKVVYSGRRTLGINILPDATVIIRVPYRTSQAAIDRLIKSKSAWINKHVSTIKGRIQSSPLLTFSNGSPHPFKGSALTLCISQSNKRFVRFNAETIDIGLEEPENEIIVQRLLRLAYRIEAEKALPELFSETICNCKDYRFTPSELVIRTMKRRWGSCSTKGKITLNSELIKMDEKYIRYVIMHELCHLRHLNHGPLFYQLLAELCPNWKTIRKEMRAGIIK